MNMVNTQFGVLHRPKVATPRCRKGSRAGSCLILRLQASTAFMPIHARRSLFPAIALFNMLKCVFGMLT